MKIAVRADASAAMGIGHVARCLTLANELHALGAEVVFVCRALPEHLAAAIRQGGHALLRLAADTAPAAAAAGAGEPPHAAWLGTSWQHDADACAAALAELGRVDWLLVDHYALDARWESALRPAVGKILVIDDLADRAHDCDVLLDANFYSDQASRYADKTGPGATLLLGPYYALLRPEFAQLRAEAGRCGPAAAPPRRVNICFGGADAGGETLTSLMALDAVFLQWNLAVDVVVGPSNPHRQAISDWAATRPYLNICVAPSDLARLMAAAAIGIGAAGTMSWERACLGLPSIAIAVAENQRRLGMDAAQIGMHVYLGSSAEVDAGALRAALHLLVANAGLRHAFAAASRQMTDGKGAARVARHLVQARLSLRAAQEQDCEALYQWRNAAENRQHAHQPGVIAYADHQRWFAASLGRADRHLLIGHDAQGAVGVLRYDKCTDHWLTSVYLVPGRHGAGLGRDLIEAGVAWMRAQYGAACAIHAEIKMDNIASQRVFQQAGYVACFTTYTTVA